MAQSSTCTRSAQSVTHSGNSSSSSQQHAQQQQLLLPVDSSHRRFGSFHSASHQRRGICFQNFLQRATSLSRRAPSSAAAAVRARAHSLPHSRSSSAAAAAALQQHTRDSALLPHPPHPSFWASPPLPHFLSHSLSVLSFVPAAVCFLSLARRLPSLSRLH